MLQAGIETRETLRQADDKPVTQLGNQRMCINFRLFTFCAIGYQNAQFVRRTLRYVRGNC